VEDALDGADLPEVPPTVTVVVPAATAAPERPARTTGGTRVPPPRRRLARRLAMVVVPVITLLAGAAIAAMVVQGLIPKPHPAPAVAAETHSGPSYRLDAADYVGRPVDEVAIQLAALGLSVQRRADPAALAAAGTVTAVDPAGRALQPGDVVTLTYASGHSGSSAGTGPDPRLSRDADPSAQGSLVPGAGPVSGNSAASTAAPTTTPAASSSSSAATTTSASSSSSAADSTASSSSGSTTSSSSSPAG
jgi:serine/threonine-protein kinase